MKKTFLYLTALSGILLSSCGTNTTSNTFTVTFNTNGGMYIAPVKVNPNSYIPMPSNPLKDGYGFSYWSESGRQWDFVNDKVNNDITLDANYVPIDYRIYYKLDGGTQNSSNPSTYNIEQSFDLYDPVKAGYSFLGWFKNGKKVESISLGNYGDITLTAGWGINSYTVTVESIDDTKGTVTGNGTFEYNSSVTVSAESADDCVFQGWFIDNELVSSDLNYTFLMPDNDLTLIAHFISKTEDDISRGTIPNKTDDGYITYGAYPQSYVGDYELVRKLNSLTSPNEKGWYFYNNEFYKKIKCTLKPNHGDYTFSDGTLISDRSEYWFKVEPIRWRPVINSGGVYTLMSDMLLDAHIYNDYYTDTKIRTDYKGDSESVYANNYKYSSLRTWLNTEFYNEAFLNNDYILTTTVDNSVTSLGYDYNVNVKYFCEDTIDKIYILSCKEFTCDDLGFNKQANALDEARRAKVSDYAIARGAFVSTSGETAGNGEYFTRSPEGYNSVSTRSIDSAGSFRCVLNVDTAGVAVRPSLTITLTK